MGTPDVASELDWEHVYDVHAPRLRRLIRRKVEAAAIDDVLQETFLRAFKSRHTMDRARPMKPWLNTIALRAIADVQRGAVRTVETLDVDTECDELALACDALDEELLTRAKQNGIKHAFASLNSRHRRLLQLVDIEGMPYEYVARHEQMTTDAVKAALARARSNFRASYVVFTEKSGLFGAGALVGSLTLKARLRLQRYQDFVTHHAPGLSTATLTIVVVAAATVPTTRSSPSEAHGSAGTSVGAAAEFVGQIAIPTSIGAGATAARADASEPATSASTPVHPVPLVSVATETGVAQQGNRYSVQSTNEVETPVSNSLDGMVIKIYCDAGLTGGAVCAVAEMAEPPR